MKHSPVVKRMRVRILFGGLICAASLLFFARLSQSQDRSRNRFPLAVTPTNQTVSQPTPQLLQQPQGQVISQPGGGANGGLIIQEGQLFINSGSPNRRSSISGSRLKLKPGQTATERALELEQQLEIANRKNRRLTDELESVKGELAQKNRELQDAIDVIRAAREELRLVRSQLNNWKKTVQILSNKIQDAEKVNRENLEKSIQLLQKQLGISIENGTQDQAPEPKKE